MSIQKQKNTKESKRKKEGEEEQHWTKPAPGRK